MSNIIVGAGSFLGNALKQKLLNSNEIVFDVSFRPGDEEFFLKSLKNLLEKENIKNLFICGGSQSSSDKLDTLNDLIQSNIFLPTAICSLVSDISDNTKIIFFGSSWQLSDQSDFSPFNLYASSKIELNPSDIRGVNKLTNLAHHSFFDSCNEAIVKSSILNN